MPRIQRDKIRYAKSDCQTWMKEAMHEQKRSQADCGEVIQMSGQNFGKRLSDMSFRYDELVAIFAYLECPTEKMVYFMTGGTAGKR